MAANNRSDLPDMPLTPTAPRSECTEHHVPAPTDATVIPDAQKRGVKRKRSGEYNHVISRLRFRLAPIRAVPDGDAHPEFPETLLSYYLLNETQLDSMALWYHQDVEQPCIWTHCYPGKMDWDKEFFSYLLDTKGPVACANSKRRMFGRFIGLYPAEPTLEEVDDKEEFLRRKERLRIKTAADALGRRSYQQW